MKTKLVDTTRRPRDPKTELPLEPKAQPGYYKGYSTMDQQPFWDEATRNVIEKRVFEYPVCRFFTPDEQKVLQAVLDIVLPQDDRDLEHQIPILNYIDARLFEKRFDGYIYEGRKEDDVAHRLGIEAVIATAHEVYGRAFTELTLIEQEAILLSIRDDRPIGANDLWTVISANHYWTLLLQDAASAYYSHPFAWDEIGFGGPAYPRGYMRLTGGLPEPWEKEEAKYEWLAPAGTASDQYVPNEDVIGDDPAIGQAGTH